MSDRKHRRSTKASSTVADEEEVNSDACMSEHESDNSCADSIVVGTDEECGSGDEKDRAAHRDRMRKENELALELLRSTICKNRMNSEAMRQMYGRDYDRYARNNAADIEKKIAKVSGGKARSKEGDKRRGDHARSKARADDASRERPKARDGASKTKGDASKTKGDASKAKRGEKSSTKSRPKTARA